MIRCNCRALLRGKDCTGGNDDEDDDDDDAGKRSWKEKLERK